MVVSHTRPPLACRRSLWYRRLWDARFDELDVVVEELKRKEKVDGRKNRE
jgi:hypothetical protein